jgi:hypothetical protein
MDYTILKTELINDPLALGYAGKSCEEIVTLLNTPISQHSKRKPNGKTPLYKVLGYLGATGVLAILDRLSKDTSSSTPQAIGAQSAALAAINIFYLSGIENLDLDDPQSQALYNALVSLGLVTQQTIDGLLALADYNISRAEYLLGQDVSLNDVQSQWPIKVVLHYPYFTTQPMVQQKYAGDSFTLTAAATCIAGCMPITYQWQKDGSDIPGATESSLTVNNAQVTDSGAYTCKATNTEAYALSNATTVTILEATNPIITVQPMSQEVDKDSSVTLSAQATGGYSFTYQWAKDTVPIEGATSQSYVINNAQVTDSGTYTCVITNVTGSTTSDNAVLTVNLVAPRIMRALRNRTAVENSQVELNPYVDGSLPMTYEWKLNGAVLPNDSEILVVTVNSSTIGTYTFTATNDAGSASTSGTLSIL